jgi:hypothetical protein
MFKFYSLSQLAIHGPILSLGLDIHKQYINMINCYITLTFNPPLVLHELL